MSILLFPGGGELDEPIIRRLLDQGDEVRVLTDPSDRGAWQNIGVHVATGDPIDAYLVERAAQNCRSVVLLPPRSTDDEVVGAVIEGAAAAGVDRLIVCVEREGAMPPVEDWSGGYVVLVRSAGRWPRAKRAEDEAVAEAIDAADDLAGTPRLTIRLTEPDDLGNLGL